MARSPPGTMPVDDHWHVTTPDYYPDPPPPALHGIAQCTPLTHWEMHITDAVPGGRDGRPHTPHIVAAMSDSDGSRQRYNRLHRWSISRSPVSPGCAGEIPAQREERRLAEAAVLVGPAGLPQAPSNPKPPAPNQCRPGKPPPLPRPLPLPPRPRVGTQTRRQTDRIGLLPPLKPATPQPPLHRWRAAQALHGPRALRRAGLQGPPRPRRRAGRVPNTAPALGQATPT